MRDKEKVERALQALAAVKKKQKPATDTIPSDPEDVAERILAVKDELDTTADEVRKLREELSRLAPWGEVDPTRFQELRRQRIYASLHELTKNELRELPAEVHVFRMAERKGVVRVLIISQATEVDLPFKPVRLPAESTTALRLRVRRKEEERRGLERALASFTPYQPALAQALAAGCEEVEFESVRLSMQTDAAIVYLRGYLPVTAVDGLKSAARAEGWGLMFSDPGPDEDVPTLIKNNRLVNVVRPVFQFLGTVPGYKEKDFLFVKSLDVRMKLLPLLSKDIRVRRFVIEEPRAVLELGADVSLAGAAASVRVRRPKAASPRCWSSPAPPPSSGGR